MPDPVTREPECFHKCCQFNLYYNVQRSSWRQHTGAIDLTANNTISQMVHQHIENASYAENLISPSLMLQQENFLSFPTSALAILELTLSSVLALLFLEKRGNLDAAVAAHGLSMPVRGSTSKTSLVPCPYRGLSSLMKNELVAHCFCDVQMRGKSED